MVKKDRTVAETALDDARIKAKEITDAAEAVVSEVKSGPEAADIRAAEVDIRNDWSRINRLQADVADAKSSVADKEKALAKLRKEFQELVGNAEKHLAKARKETYNMVASAEKALAAERAGARS